MPKVVQTAADILNMDAGSPAPTAVAIEPVVVPPAPPEAPPAGFAPPPGVAPAPQVAESLLSQARGSVETPDEETEEKAVEEAPAADLPKTWAFVKNIHPGEKLDLGDGEEFVFPSVLFRTQDPVLAEKILAIAEQHGIVLQ